MTYSSKEYYKKFMVTSFPAKRERELVIVEKLSELFNKKKFSNFEELKNNNKNFDEFVKNNNLINVLKHFEGRIEEEEYQNILSSFKKYMDAKLEFDKTGIQTITIDDHQYNSYKGKEQEYYFDNSGNNRTLEQQMKDLQPTEEKFQTIDKTENTEQMMQEMSDRKKETINFVLLMDVNYDNLSTEEKEIFDVAKKHEIETKQKVKIDIEKALLLVNEKILKIYKEDNIYKISESSIKNENNTNEVKSQKSPQKKMVLNSNIYH